MPAKKSQKKQNYFFYEAMKREPTASGVKVGRKRENEPKIYSTATKMQTTRTVIKNM
jgi:hypothetical protein